MKKGIVVTRNEWDSRFFKRKIGDIICARKPVKNGFRHSLRRVLARAAEDGFEYLVVTLGKIPAWQREILSSEGFEVCDSSVDLRMKTPGGLGRAVPGKYKVGFADKLDIESLKRIAEKSFRRSRLYRMKFAKSKDVDRYHHVWVKNLFKGKASYVMVAKTRDKVIGFIGFTVDVTAGSSRINLIAASSSTRGKGVGSSLMAGYLAYAEKRGVKTLYVKTQEDNVLARKFYKKLGYKEYSFESKYHIFL